MIVDIFLTILLVFLNGFFVAAEFALVKVRLSQLELRIQAGSRLAVIAKTILDNLDAYLSASQLGITLASLALGWIGESVVAHIVMSLFAALGLNISPVLAHQIAIPVAFVTITALHIVLGEQAPKWLAIQRPEPVVMMVAIPMRVFYTVFKPFIWVLNHVANALLRVFGIVATHGEVHSADELRYLLERGKESGAIESSEHELIENVFAFGELTAKQIMVPRTSIHAIDVATPTNVALAKIADDGYSRLPVYKDTIDTVIGIVYAKDVLTMVQHRELILLHDILHPAYFVPETKSVSHLLREFQKRRIHVAIVIDEFGGTAGMVTLEDILEELVGDIMDEYDEEVPQFQTVKQDEFIVNAKTPITEINELLPAPLPESERYETLGGLLNVLFGKIPEEHAVIIHAGYECTILKTSKRSVETVRLRYIAEESVE